MGSTNQTELEYQLAWARTYLKNYGIITNSSRGVWAITPEFSTQSDIDDPGVIIRRVTQNGSNKIGNSDNNYPKGNNKDEDKPEDENPENDNIEFPDEFKPWKQQLSDVLLNMDPYAFERLTQRLLRECGFTSVNVTKKSNDGGIDGTGKLKINGIFSFNVAFQCKRYKGTVSAGDIRDFRGSLTTDIEKGIFLTTGKFTQAAKDEASNPGKQQIDLIDGEDFINKLAEYKLGLEEVTDYKINYDFFSKL